MKINIFRKTYNINNNLFIDYGVSSEYTYRVEGEHIEYTDVL